MRIEQLEQVIKIVETGSISRAARELYMSQSNLSQSVKSLEAELGRPIFRRTPTGVELTPFGGEFLVYARPAYGQFQLLGDYCRQSRHKTPVTLSMACQYFRFAHLLFQELYRRYRDAPNQFTYLECSFLDIVDKVASQLAEFGVITISRHHRKTTLQLFQNRGLSYVQLAQYPAAVTLGRHNPLYHREGDGVTLDLLAGYPMVMYSDMNFNFTSELETLNIHNLHSLITVSDRATMHEMLENTDAYSVAVYTGAYRHADYYPNIRALELLDRRFVMEVGYIHSIGRPLSNIAEEYIVMLAEMLRGGPGGLAPPGSNTIPP